MRFLCYSGEFMLFDTCQTNVRQVSYECLTRVKRLSDRCRTQKERAKTIWGQYILYYMINCRFVFLVDSDILPSATFKILIATRLFVFFCIFALENIV